MGNPANEKWEPIPVDPNCFNTRVELPYELTIDAIRKAMEEFVEFLRFLNEQLVVIKGLPKLEVFIMPANFSSLVGEFMAMTIPKYCRSLVRNKYHNGFPDLLPRGEYKGDAVLHGKEGIEIKASRYSSGWQGHNQEEGWFLIFQFDSNSANDLKDNKAPKPFVFKGVYCARLQKEDWTFSARKGKSRRTITASIKKSGVEKLKRNWIYLYPCK